MTNAEYMKRWLAKGARGANHTLVRAKIAGDAAGVERARANRAEALRQARLYKNDERLEVRHESW